MEEPDRHIEVRWVTAEQLFQLAAVSAQPVARAQEVGVESLRLLIGPERIERTDIKRFGLARATERSEQINLFLEEVILLILERGSMLTYRAERLVEILLLNQMINEFFDDLEGSGIRRDQAAEEIGALVLSQAMPAS